MPSIGTKIPRKKKIIGYKIAVKDGRRYRSIFTWHVYQAGKHIAKFKYNKKKEIIPEVPYPLRNHTWFCFDEKYNGYTSVFQNEEDAILTNIGIGGFWLQTLPQKIVVLKMTLSDDLRVSFTGHKYMGKKIEKIEEVKLLHNGNK